MPWIAFVPDISGVCSVAGTLPIRLEAKKDRQQEDIE